MGSEEPHKGRDFEIRYKTKDFWKIVWAHIRLNEKALGRIMQISYLSTIIIFKTSKSPHPDFVEGAYVRILTMTWFILWLSIPNFYGNISVFGLGVGQELSRRTDIGKWIYPLSRCKRVSKLLNFRRNIFIDLLAENLLPFWNADFHSENVFKIMKYVVVDIFVT